MQERGVSKRVRVQFDQISAGGDVSKDVLNKVAEAETQPAEPASASGSDSTPEPNPFRPEIGPPSPEATTRREQTNLDEIQRRVARIGRRAKRTSPGPQNQPRETRRHVGRQ